jgi:hypothetical protein
LGSAVRECELVVTLAIGALRVDSRGPIALVAGARGVRQKRGSLRASDAATTDDRRGIDRLNGCAGTSMAFGDASWRCASVEGAD